LCIAIVKVQRDFGNRADRKVARMKYLIHNWGLARFKAKVEEYFGDELEPLRPVGVHGFNDGMGWHEQGDGRWFYGLNIENGRIKDCDTMQLKSALRAICGELRPPLRLTPHQSIIFCDIAPENRARLEDILRRHNVPLTEDYTAVRRWSMACPALPTCGLAVSESERVMPSIIDRLEGELKKLNFIYKDLVPTSEVVPTLASVLRYFKNARQNGESFGDFCYRLGKDALAAHCEGPLAKASSSLNSPNGALK
jgi:sulfite reductase (ferredoxin)